MTATMHNKALGDILGGLPVLSVALSGGVDSRFLVHMAQRAGCRVHVLHAAGPHVAERETRHALHWARARGLGVTVVPFDPLELPPVASGAQDRCYHCKKAMMLALLATATPHPLCDGTNADDLAAHRPGLRALRELGIRSPLAEAGLQKADIRRTGEATGLEDPQQAARPCLLTRLPYGMSPEAGMLRNLARAEAALEDMGLDDFRLRLRTGLPPLLQLGPLSPRVAQAHGARVASCLRTATAGRKCLMSRRDKAGAAATGARPDDPKGSCGPRPPDMTDDARIGPPDTRVISPDTRVLLSGHRPYRVSLSDTLLHEAIRQRLRACGFHDVAIASATDVSGFHDA